MDSDGLPMIGSGVDYSEVTAIHQKRTLAFINYFITNTASFLNNFSRAVESRITEYESKIQKLEAAMDILEAKLSSVPGLDEETTILVNKTQSVTLEPTSALENTPSEVTNEVPVVKALPLIPDVPSDMTPAKDHPRYKRFFRMLQVGVPEPGVKQKMQAEGLDPEILSHPGLMLSSIEESNQKENSSGSASD